MTSFINGKIFTGRSTTDFVSSMTIENGKITWVGDRANIADSNAIDLHGKTVLPGLIDVHTHPKYIADALHGVACTPPNVNSIKEMQNALRNSPEFGKATDSSHAVWIEGWGFDETKLAEHRTPTIVDLDAVSTEQPIFIYRSDCHSSVVNSKALELAGIDSKTKNPAGGEIGHFPDGRPNGYLKEVAATQLVIRIKSQNNYAGDVENMVNTSDHYMANGLVAICEMMGRKRPFTSAQLFHDAEKLGFTPKVSIYYVYDEVAGDTQVKQTGSSHLRTAGIKVFMDGSISGQTAFNKQPYPDGHTGVCITNKAKLTKAVEFARINGLQIAIHAMGDAAVQMVINVTKNMKPWLTDEPSVRIEHATLLSDEMLNEINHATMKYALVTQPIFYFAEDESYREYLSHDQFTQAYRIKSMLNSNAMLALSSDAPCTPWAEPDSPFVAIYAAVTRKAANGDIINSTEAISVPEAILGYTNWAAKIGGFHHNGQLAPGYAGDFVVLTNDIFTVPDEQLKSIRVAQTWMAGKQAYIRRP